MNLPCECGDALMSLPAEVFREVAERAAPAHRCSPGQRVVSFDSDLHESGLISACDSDVLEDLLGGGAGLEALDHGGLSPGQEVSEGRCLGVGCPASTIFAGSHSLLSLIRDRSRHPSFGR